MHFAWTATGLCYRSIPNVTAEDVSVYSIRRLLRPRSIHTQRTLSIQHTIHTYSLQLRTIGCVGPCLYQDRLQNVFAKEHLIWSVVFFLSRFERQIAKIRQRKQLTVCLSGILSLETV